MWKRISPEALCISHPALTGPCRARGNPWTRTTGLRGPSGGTQTPRPTACPPPRARPTAEGPRCRVPASLRTSPCQSWALSCRASVWLRRIPNEKLEDNVRWAPAPSAESKQGEASQGPAALAEPPHHVDAPTQSTKSWWAAWHLASPTSLFVLYGNCFFVRGLHNFKL